MGDIAILTAAACICLACMIVLLISGEVILNRLERKSDEARKAFGEKHGRY